MEKVDFFALPRALQERILGGIEGRFPPVPMLSRRLRVAIPWVWIGLAASALAGLLVVHQLGYGVLGSAMGQQSIAILPVYVVLAAAAVYGLVAVLAVYVRVARLPYPPGVYAYGARVLDARSHPMVNLSLSGLERIEQKGTEVHLTFAKAGTLVVAGDPANLPSAIAELEAGRDRALEIERNGAESREAQDALVLIDPLHQPRFSNPVGEHRALRYELPAWARFGWAIAIALGLSLGSMAFFLRNRGSDTKLYARACEQGTAQGFEQYLQVGKAHQTEVRRVRLPRAELAAAKAQNSVQALLAFEKTHPDTDIGAELASAKKAAYTRELDAAKQPKTLAALGDFQKSFPGHGLDGELSAAMHELYMDAKSKYGTVEPKSGKTNEAAAFLTKLIGSLEGSGATVEIRFHRRDGVTMARVDKDLAKITEYMGEISHPTHYFDEAHAQARQQLFGESLSAILSSTFPKEVLSVKLGTPVAAEEKVLPAVTVPTIFVTSFEDWSGHTYIFKKPRGVFIGVFFNYTVDFVLPKDAATYHTKEVVFRPVSLALVKELESAPRTNPPIEETIYESMSVEARKQFLAKFFKNLLGVTVP
jgi:hypothetical protein